MGGMRLSPRPAAPATTHGRDRWMIPKSSNGPHVQRGAGRTIDHRATETRRGMPAARAGAGPTCVARVGDRSFLSDGPHVQRRMTVRRARPRVGAPDAAAPSDARPHGVASLVTNFERWTPAQRARNLMHRSAPTLIFEFEDRAHVKEVNGAAYGGRAGEAAALGMPFGIVGYTMSKTDRRPPRSSPIIGVFRSANGRFHYTNKERTCQEECPLGGSTGGAVGLRRVLARVGVRERRAWIR